MRFLTTTDMMYVVEWWAVGQLSWSSQISYEVIASLHHIQSVCAVKMSLYSIAAKYNETLEAAHAYIDDDRYDVVEWWAVGQLNWTSQISYEFIASLHHMQSICAVQMSLYSIAAK